AETQIINRAANINNLINSQEVYNWIKDSNDLYEKSNESGIGTSADKKLEFEIYQKAANLGNAHGMNNLGCCYESGIGTDVDKQKAFELYQKAASLGNPYGMNNLGHCYHNGIGTNIDKKKAFEFYQKATDLGNLYGMNNLGNCYISGIGTAYMYEHGYGVMKDMNQPSGTLGGSLVEFGLFEILGSLEEPS
ncbi:hypothetical protein C1645_835420, partial [Glomus cerebriforme]